MSLRTLFSTLTTSTTSLIEGTAKSGSIVMEHIERYHKDVDIRNLEHKVTRTKRVQEIAKEISKVKLTKEDISILKDKLTMIDSLFEDKEKE